jgi:large subunit ribosomal protein L10
MPSIVKKLAAAELTAALEDADSLVVIGLDGLDMPENEGLRNKLAENGVALRVVPNKIARRVLSERGMELPEEAFKGQTAIAVGTAETAIAAAKVVKDSKLRKDGKLVMRAGALEGAVLGAADAVALAEVPDKNTLRAQILGCLVGPAQGLVRIHDHVQRTFLL